MWRRDILRGRPSSFISNMRNPPPPPGTRRPGHLRRSIARGAPRRTGRKSEGKCRPEEAPHSSTLDQDWRFRRCLLCGSRLKRLRAHWTPETYKLPPPHMLWPPFELRPPQRLWRHHGLRPPHGLQPPHSRGHPMSRWHPVCCGNNLDCVDGRGQPTAYRDPIHPLGCGQHLGCDN